MIARWQPGDDIPVQVLAMRDELASRPFDVPDRWWPEAPHAVGGRDRRAGGTWCVSDVATGATAVVLNRPERRTALPGAASRGVLPLLAVRHGAGWPDHLDVAAMAGFNLVLLRPDSAQWWSFDGTDLAHADLDAGTYQVKPRGLTDGPLPLPDDGLAVRGVADGAIGDDTVSTDALWGPWIGAVRAAEPTDDGSGLLVRRQVGDDSYETVFGQLIAARPGLLRLDYRARVARADGPWTTRVHVEPPGSSQPGRGAQRWVS